MNEWIILIKGCDQIWCWLWNQFLPCWVLNLIPGYCYIWPAKKNQKQIQCGINQFLIQFSRHDNIKRLYKAQQLSTWQPRCHLDLWHHIITFLLCLCKCNFLLFQEIHWTWTEMNYLFMDSPGSSESYLCNKEISYLSLHLDNMSLNFHFILCQPRNVLTNILRAWYPLTLPITKHWMRWSNC